MKLSVVIPCLNERLTLATAISMAKDLVTSIGGDGEVVVADNGSTDGSQDIAVANGAHVVNVPDKGYGNALMGGIAGAKGDILVMGDADSTYDFREARALVESVERGVDLAMGSRLRGEIEKGAMPFLHRYFGTPALSLLIRILYRLPITDCNCGMRAFSRRAYERMVLRSPGMEFASEMLCRAALVGLKVSEDPISLHKDPRVRDPHIRTWRDGWRHLKLIVRMRFFG